MAVSWSSRSRTVIQLQAVRFLFFSPAGALLSSSAIQGTSSRRRDSCTKDDASEMLALSPDIRFRSPKTSGIELRV